MSDSDSSGDSTCGTAIVIDNGSDTCKAGFSGDDAPVSVFPTIIARPRHFPGIPTRVSLFGDEALSKRGILGLRYPIENGIVTSWDDMERIWHHTFYDELRIAPEEHPVLLSEAPLNPDANREKMTERMFESFNVPALYASIQGVLALYTSGDITGVAVDLGEGVSLSVPVYEGHVIRETEFLLPMSQPVSSIDLGGSDLTDHLIRLLSGKYSFTTSADRQLARDMKEKLCSVALDYDENLKSTTNDSEAQTYELPSGLTFTLNCERFECPEALFRPLLIGKKCYGIHEMVYDSINKITCEFRSNLYKHIVLCGGISMFPGTAERLTKEVSKLAIPNTSIKVTAQPERKYSAWIGGSILAALSTFRNMCISKAEYDEVGPSIVHSKCV